jgi:hypothetical protein
MLKSEEKPVANEWSQANERLGTPDWIRLPSIRVPAIAAIALPQERTKRAAAFAGFLLWRWAKASSNG